MSHGIGDALHGGERGTQRLPNGWQRHRNDLELNIISDDVWDAGISNRKFLSGKPLWAVGKRVEAIFKEISATSVQASPVPRQAGRESDLVYMGKVGSGWSRTMFSPLLRSTAPIHNEVSNIAISHLPKHDRRCTLRPKDSVKE